jgi:hypothetical protein
MPVALMVAALLSSTMMRIAYVLAVGALFASMSSRHPLNASERAVRSAWRRSAREISRPGVA